MASPELSPPPSLDGFPPEVREAYTSYTANKDAAGIVRFVLLATAFLAGREEAGEYLQQPGEARLREDLGVDSIAVAELVFLVEDLFEITVTDADLQSIATLGDLQKMILAKAGLSEG